MSGLSRRFSACCRSLCAAPLLAAQTEEALALSLILPHGPAPEPRLQQVLVDSVGLELSASGCRCCRNPPCSEPGVELTAAGCRLRPAAAFSLCRRLESRYLLAGIYSVSGDGIRVDFSWYDLKRRRASAVVSARSAMILDLDAAVAEAVDLLLRDGDFPRRLAGASRFEAGRRPRAALPVLASFPAPAVAGGRAGAGRAAGGAGSAAAAAAGPARRSLSTRRRRLRPPPRRARFASRRFELAVGFTPFLVSGTAAGYLATGVMPTLGGAWWRQAGPGRIGIGASLGLGHFWAAGSTHAAELYLVPLGGELLYALPLLRGLQATVRLGGGPALFVLNPDRSGTMAKPVPFLSAGAVRWTWPSRRAGGCGWGPAVSVLRGGAADKRFHPLPGRRDAAVGG